MKTWMALKSIAILAGLFAVLLLLNAGALAMGWSEYIIPPPETTAEQLVGALGAHRYEGAMNQLSQDLQQQVKAEDLQALVKDLENSPLQGIQDAHGQQSQAQGEQATAVVEIVFGNNQKQEVAFQLKKENGLWKVTSLDPLRTIGANPP